MPHQHICLPFDSEAHYQTGVQDLMAFRQHLAKLRAAHPELLPSGFAQGFTFWRSLWSLSFSPNSQVRMIPKELLIGRRCVSNC